jgi:tyrosyl-tRNA synthetase
MQIADADIEHMLPKFSLRSMSEIAEILADQKRTPESRVAQRTLARELTVMLHGEEAADAAEQAADVLFGAHPVSASPAALHLIASEVASSSVGSAALTDAVGILVTTGLASSNSEARRLLSQRSVRANGEQMDEHSKLDKIPLLHGRWLLLRKGKTAYHLLDLQG